MMGFAREQHVKAVRKAHRCDGCSGCVEAGSPAVRWAGMADGDFGTAIYHPDCRQAEVGLNALHDTWAPYDWIALIDMDPEDREWLLVEHPTVAKRLGVAGDPA